MVMDIMVTGAAASPCTGVCTLDTTRAYCLGCLRTLAEIARWSGASEGERQAMLATLAERTDDGRRP